METAHSFTAPHKIALTIKEAARASSISRSLLYVAIGQGALHARKLGGRTLILEADLQQFLRSLPRSAEIETALQPSRRCGKPRKAETSDVTRRLNELTGNSSRKSA